MDNMITVRYDERDNLTLKNIGCPI